MFMALPSMFYSARVFLFVFFFTLFVALVDDVADMGFFSK